MTNDRTQTRIETQEVIEVEWVMVHEFNRMYPRVDLDTRNYVSDQVVRLFTNEELRDRGRPIFSTETAKDIIEAMSRLPAKAQTYFIDDVVAKLTFVGRERRYIMPVIGRERIDIMPAETARRIIMENVDGYSTCQ